MQKRKQHQFGTQVLELLQREKRLSYRVLKRRFYQRMGVTEYWIVDVDARMVERWRPGDERPEVIAAMTAADIIAALYASGSSPISNRRS